MKSDRTTHVATPERRRLESLDELPDEEVDYLRRAVELNEKGVKVPTAGRRKKREPIEVPDDPRAILDQSSAATETFDGFSHTYEKEHAEWITEAKRGATRE